MKFIFDRGNEGIRILRCFGYDGNVELPESIGGVPVTEIGSYAFAETLRGAALGPLYQVEWTGAESNGEGTVWNGCLASAKTLEDGTPAVCGDRLCSVRFPSALRRIGRYAFYNCEKLERLTLFCTIRDLGAGLFTGCYGISRLDVTVIPGEKSCLKEVLSELRQTLRLIYRNEQGRIQARLLFPEFFEESVENTPARILMREMHGCGHMYRNAFVNTDFQFHTYDRLFPHVQVQEKPELVTELVLGRLQYPCQLSEEAAKHYEEYAASHGKEIVQVALQNQEEQLLRFVGNAAWCGEACMEQMLEAAGIRADPQAMGILMDVRNQKRMAVGEEHTPVKKRRRFEL